MVLSKKINENVIKTLLNILIKIIFSFLIPPIAADLFIKFTSSIKI